MIKGNNKHSQLIININHQSSKSYITALLMYSQCHATIPIVRTQPFYLTDLSETKLKQVKSCDKRVQTPGMSHLGQGHYKQEY